MMNEGSTLGNAKSTGVRLCEARRTNRWRGRWSGSCLTSSPLQVRDGDGGLLVSTGPVERNARVREAIVPVGGGLPGSVCVAMSETALSNELSWLGENGHGQDPNSNR